MRYLSFPGLRISPWSRFNDRGKVGRLQGSAADEAAVHVRLWQQLGRVAGVHGAAVLNRDALGSRFAVQGLDRRAITAQTSFACSAVAVLPVPMAQTGS